jgi:DNA-binding CsgD family transcriptional regulator
MELTKQQTKIVGLIADGLKPREAAQKLAISHYTVETHLKTIKAKMGVKTLAHMISYSFRNKIIE